MGGAAGLANCCLAQMVLERGNITTTTPKDLGDMIGVSPTAAGYILRSLDWRREPNPQTIHSSIYHYDGIPKEFTIGAVTIARVRLSRLLGISKEDLAEVLA